MLMLVGSLPVGEEEPTQTVAVRFFESEEGCKRVLALAKNQVRRNFPTVNRKQIVWTVYEPQTKRGGWPVWLGPASYYS